jgi:hypothetical protein
MTNGSDPEFDNLDNSIDFELDDVPDNFKKPITESYATKEFEIPNFDAEIVDEFEDEGIKGYNIVYSKNGTDIVEVEVWETDSPVAVNRNLHTPNLMQGYYSSFDAFASDLEYKTSKYVRVRESADRKPITEAKTDPFHDAIFEAIDYLTEFNDIFPVPQNIGAGTWKELKDDINYGLSSDFEIAEIIMEYLDKDLAISRKHPEMFEDDPQSELTLETYNRLKRAYDRAVAAYEAEHSEDFEESCERKPIPEGMTIEQLVEEMEENEDTVECTWCEDLFDKSECRYEVNLGWLCSRCEAAIKSRGETLTFKENNYWDFLDESAAIKDSTVIGKHVRLVENGADMNLATLKHILKINREYALPRKKIDFIVTFDNDCIIRQETDLGYLITIPCYYRNPVDRSKILEQPEYHLCWISKKYCEIIGLEEELEPEELHDLGNEYDGGYPADANDGLTEASLSDIATAANSELGSRYTARELLDDAGVEDMDFFADLDTRASINYEEPYTKYRQMQKAKAKKALDSLSESPEVTTDTNNGLVLCPECGFETLDVETGICINCGFNSLT